VRALTITARSFHGCRLSLLFLDLLSVVYLRLFILVVGRLVRIFGRGGLLLRIGLFFDGSGSGLYLLLLFLSELLVALLKQLLCVH